MNELFFNRVARLNIEGKIFEYNLKKNQKFLIEFSNEFDVATISTNSTIKIYNVNDETKDLARPKKVGNVKKYSLVTLEAGYNNNSGIVLTGEIYDTKVSKNGVDTVLELKAGGNVSKFQGFIINKTYNGQSTSSIVKSILSESGFDSSSIKPEKEISYPSFVATDLKSSLQRLAKDSGSELFINNNGIYFLSPKKSNDSVLLSWTSGLLQEPEKTDSGYSVKCLFNYRIQPASEIKIEGKKKYVLRVQRGKHEFSTTGQAITTFEGTEIKGAS